MKIKKNKYIKNVRLIKVNCTGRIR